jgi:tRNA G10  N-methylase Trm11
MAHLANLVRVPRWAVTVDPIAAARRILSCSATVEQRPLTNRIAAFPLVRPVMPDTDLMSSDSLLVICARAARHELIAAEASSLCGGVPDGDGVAHVDSIDLVARAAFVHTGVRVIAHQPTFDELVDAVGDATFEANRFRIDVHDPSDRLDRPSHHTAMALADVIPFGPDLRDPVHRFMVVATDDGLRFGEVVASTDSGYRVHDSKPWTTSSSLDSRFSRGLVNLVPEATSVLDPCCGAGSIVLEAALLGLEAYAVDWKAAMVGMTRENLAHFGYTAEVTRADSREFTHPVDAVVTDLPYGHAIKTDEVVVRGILERCSSLAPVGVFVAPAGITDWLTAAGFSRVEVHTVMKRRGFTRWIHIARR